MATYLGCGPGSNLWNPDRVAFGADPDPLPLDPECKPCGCADGGSPGGCGGSCGCAGGCAAGMGSATGVKGGAALPGLDRAAEMSDMLKNAIPPIRGTQGSFPMGGSWRLNPVTGNLVAQIHTPESGVYDPRPVLTYNSLSTTDTEFGYGWTEMHRQRITETIPNADVTKGTGAVLRYTAGAGAGTYGPPAGAKNKLVKNLDGS